MDLAAETGPALRLIVFSDDWGRHPSSCQHLVRHLLGRIPVLWVDTIGMRPVALSWQDLRKVSARLHHWLRPSRRGQRLSSGLTLIAPPMWPGFRTTLQRRLNAHLVTRAVNRALGPRLAGERRVVLTTLPITADLVGRLEVDRWLYYCVDDFSAWPGLDNRVLKTMERDQLRRVDGVVAATTGLSRRLADLGRSATVLTHGVDLAHWSPSREQPTQERAVQPCSISRTELQTPSPSLAKLRERLSGIGRPLVLFWGLVDRRLDLDWCRALVRALAPGGTLLLVGPLQAPDPALRRLDRVELLGPVPHDALPILAAQADLLVLPYADLPVTRPMEALKLKEYLATGKPVVARSLPDSRQWADAADLVETAEAFVAAVQQRLCSGVPLAQLEARKRLATESWERKAQALEAILASL
jgi:glycosyltransferase involved in cell wall biosynthesis